jgi:hypothetical protein
VENGDVFREAFLEDGEEVLGGAVWEKCIGVRDPCIDTDL